MPEDVVLTADDLATRYRVNRSSIHRWSNDGTFPPPDRKVGKGVGWSETTIKQFEAGGCVTDQKRWWEDASAVYSAAAKMRRLATTERLHESAKALACTAYNLLIDLSVPVATRKQIADLVSAKLIWDNAGNVSPANIRRTESLTASLEALLPDVDPDVKVPMTSGRCAELLVRSVMESPGVDDEAYLSEVVEAVNYLTKPMGAADIALVCMAANEIQKAMGERLAALAKKNN